MFSLTNFDILSTFSITFSITLTQLFIKFVAFRGNLFKLTLLMHIIPNIVNLSTFYTQFSIY